MVCTSAGRPLFSKSANLMSQPQLLIQVPRAKLSSRYGASPRLQAPAAALQVVESARLPPGLAELWPAACDELTQ